MDYIVHGVAKSQTQLSDFHFHFPVVRTLCSHCRRPRFDPWLGKLRSCKPCSAAKKKKSKKETKCLIYQLINCSIGLSPKNN